MASSPRFLVSERGWEQRRWRLLFFPGFSLFFIVSLLLVFLISFWYSFPWFVSFWMPEQLLHQLLAVLPFLVYDFLQLLFSDVALGSVYHAPIVRTALTLGHFCCFFLSQFLLPLVFFFSFFWFTMLMMGKTKVFCKDFFSLGIGGGGGDKFIMCRLCMKEMSVRRREVSVSHILTDNDPVTYYYTNIG